MGESGFGGAANDEVGDAAFWKSGVIGADESGWGSLAQLRRTFRGLRRKLFLRFLQYPRKLIFSIYS